MTAAVGAGAQVEEEGPGRPSRVDLYADLYAKAADKPKVLDLAQK